MDFFTINKQPRPVTLSEGTRRFAYDSLHCRYGLDTIRTPHITLSAEPGMTPLDCYDKGIRAIAEQAPIRICEGEMISGAATLGDAIAHFVPFSIDGREQISSVSHLTVDFESVLKRGLDAIRQDAEDALAAHTGEKQRRFLKSCISCLDSFDIWHGRYLKALEGRDACRRSREALRRVPHQPAADFYEAVQSLWFTFAFIRLCGNWPGIGRLDYLLGPYLERDLESGKITREQAKEILAHFFIKGCEWIKGGDCGSGDAQHYQNIVLAGVDENGNEVTNTVTYLVLEIIEELGISDFPTTVRLNAHTDDRLKRRVAEVIRYGGGILAVYNEDLILRSLTDFGYAPQDARRFANDGCWEVQIPGETCFSYVPFDSLKLLQQVTLKGYSGEAVFSSYEQLLAAYEDDLRRQVRQIIREFDPTENGIWREDIPCTVVSLFERGCIEKGASYLEGGPLCNMISPHIGGLPDTVNALYAIKKLVFDERRVTFPELMKILRGNWRENEALRQYAANHYRYFGNDNAEADGIAAHLLDRFADFCREESEGSPVRFPSGVSTFGRQIEWAPCRMATPAGNYAGQVLSGNLSPTPGTDVESVTATIRSYCGCDLVRQTTGAALDVRLLSENIRGDAGIAALMSLMDGFVALGGFFMQLDVASTDCLREAQKHPENYPTLSVRVSGWNARFVTLNRQWQDMIIGQMEGTV